MRSEIAQPQRGSVSIFQMGSIHLIDGVHPEANGIVFECLVFVADICLELTRLS